MIGSRSRAWGWLRETFEGAVLGGSWGLVVHAHRYAASLFTNGVPPGGFWGYGPVAEGMVVLGALLLARQRGVVAGLAAWAMARMLGLVLG